MSEITLELVTAQRVERSYAILCAVLLPLVLFFALARPWEQTSEFWGTAAAVRAASENLAHPDNPVLNLPGSTSPLFTPYTLFWGAAMQWSGWNIFTVMALAAVTNFLWFVTGLFRFVSQVTRAGILATYMLVIMLLVWGTGYRDASSYSLPWFLETLPNGSMFAYGMTFHGLAFLRKFLDWGRPQDVIWYGLLMILTFIVHPITAVFGFVAAIALVAADREWRKLVLLQAVPLAALGTAVLWPYFDYWKLLVRGAGSTWPDVPMFRNQLEALGPALVGVPVAIYFGLRERHQFVLYGLTMCALIYVSSLMLQIGAGSRFLIFSVLYLHLAIAVYLYEHGVHKRRSLQGWASGHGYLIIIVFSVFVPGIWQRAQDFAAEAARMYDPPLHFHKYASPMEPAFQLGPDLTSSHVVLADDSTGWALPAITGARIVSQVQTDPLITGEINVRRQSVAAFLYAPIATKERVAIIRRFRVTHILLDESRANAWNESLRRDLELIAVHQVQAGKLHLYRVTI